MGAKRKSHEEDWERLIENLYTNRKKYIKDRESFEDQYFDYFSPVYEGIGLGKTKSINKAWKLYKEEYLKDSDPKPGGQTEKKRKQPKERSPTKLFDKIGWRWNKKTNQQYIAYGRVINTKRGQRIIDKTGKYISLKPFDPKKGTKLKTGRWNYGTE